VVESDSVAAFQLRVKDVGQHELARLAEPLQRTCADAGVAFIVNDSMSLAKRLGAEVSRQAANERTVEVREAQDSAAPYAGTAFQEVHAPAALVAVCRQFGVAEDAEFRHGPRGVPVNADPGGVARGEGDSHYTRSSADVHHRNALLH